LVTRGRGRSGTVALGEIRRTVEQADEGEVPHWLVGQGNTASMRCSSDPVRPGTCTLHRKGQRYRYVQGDRKPRAGMPLTLPMSSKIFTIFEGTSEIQRMIIGRSVAGLDVR
jgi:hypothetical protein